MQLIRIRFSKRDEAAYISHLDLQRVMARALRISGLPVWYSQGFNPHIYMSFALPLPLLQHSETEFVDCKTEAEGVDFSDFLTPLNAALPKGIVAYEIYTPCHTAGEIASADYQVTYPDTVLLADACKGYNDLATALVTRRTKRSEQQVDLKEHLPKLQPEGAAVRFRLPAGGTLNYNPALVTGFLEQAFRLPAAHAYVLRKALYTAGEEVFR